VAFRENNNIFVINACQMNRPPILVAYLVDQYQPGDIRISDDGLTYTVRRNLRTVVHDVGPLCIYLICARISMVTSILSSYLEFPPRTRPTLDSFKCSMKTHLYAQMTHRAH